jgi:hypothetical protein
MLKGHKFIFLSESVEVEIQLSCHDGLRIIFDYRGIQRNLHFCDTQDVVQCVEASDWVKAHEVRYVQKILRLEVFELSIFCEKLSELQ